MIKLVISLTVIFVFNASAESYSQISIRAKGQPLAEVMVKVQEQSGLPFILKGKEQAETKINIDLGNASLKAVMDAIVKDQPFDWSIQDHTIVIKHREQPMPVGTGRPASQPSASGRVTNVNGEALEGVTVTVVGTARSTATDEQGRYTIQAAVGETLRFTLVGFAEANRQLGSLVNIDVTMEEDLSELDEVVVVGMNLTQTKRAITGSMATIQTKELKQSPVANLNNALAGRLPGLITVQTSGQPGDDAANIYIRGIATYGSSSPLVVVDGLPRRTGFSHIDPNEVESISILKDASSSALYGIQGANGVVVVTTKRGRANQEPVIDFTYQTAVQQTTRLPTLANTYEAALYTNDKDRNSGVTPRFTDEVIEIIRSGAEPYLYPDVNWFDELLAKSTFQNHYNLNISGSTNRVRYFVSGSHINQNSMLKYDEEFYDNYRKKSGFSRYNFRSNIDIEATRNLQIQVDLAGRLEGRIRPATGFENIFSTLGSLGSYAMPMFNPDGSLGATSNFVGDPFFKNPYGLITQSGYYESSLNTMYGTVSARHKLDFVTKGLSAQLFFSFENENNNHTRRERTFDAFWYRGLDNEGNPIYQQTQIESTLSTSGTNNIEKSSYLDARLIYETSWNDVHNFGAQVLANRTLRLFNYDLPYAYQGISGRVTYNYASKLFAEANIGYNGSENFPPDSRYGFFPSVSAGWILSDEEFMSAFENINFLKLRGSFGEVGNDKIGGQRWLYLTDYVGGGGYEFGVSPGWRGGFNESRIGNPFVTWERSRKANIGFELSLFKSQLLQLTFDVFREKRTNILTDPGTVADYLGLGTSLSALNRGIVRNQGLDGELRFNKRWTSGFGLFANFQLTYARNKILENDQPTPAFDYQDLRGHEVGYVLGYKSAGLFQSQEEITSSAVQPFDNKVIPGDIRYVDINDDGVINEFDRVPIQNQNVPRYVGGFSFGASYKGLDVSFLLNGAQGGTSTHFVRENTSMITQLWTEENKATAKFPGAKVSSNNTLLSDFFTYKTDYLKLRNAEIGYMVSGNWIKAIRVNYLRFFVNGQNLAVWDKLSIKDRDPEVNGDGFSYPIQRIVNFGLNVRF